MLILICYLKLNSKYHAWVQIQYQSLHVSLISSWENLLLGKKDNFTQQALLNLYTYSLDKLDSVLINFSVNIDAENTSGLQYKIINAAKTLQNLYPVENSKINFENNISVKLLMFYLFTIAEFPSVRFFTQNTARLIAIKICSTQIWINDNIIVLSYSHCCFE